MSESRLTAETDARKAASELIRQHPPVLVEVRFPNMGTSSDWYLIQDEEDFDTLLERLGPRAELHLNSVWELKSSKGAVRLVK